MLVSKYHTSLKEQEFPGETAVQYKVNYKFKVQGEPEVACAREQQRTQRLMEIGQKFTVMP